MGMQIGTNNTNKTSITYKKPDGTPVGTLTITKINNKNKKKKRLGYNFKRISTQILATKTSTGAGKVVREARGTVVSLLLKKNTGDFDDQELRHALTHAREMERIAKKRRKHMEEEERAEDTGSALVEEEADLSKAGEQEEEESPEISEEDLEKLERELKQMMDESMEDLNELADELMDASWEEMDPREIENMKKRHRADELREIMEADMKYLKALFDRLAKEKQANANGSNSVNNPESGVSLEISGVEMPVEAAPAPVATEGASLDVSV